MRSRWAWSGVPVVALFACGGRIDGARAAPGDDVDAGAAVAQRGPDAAVPNADAAPPTVPTPSNGLGALVDSAGASVQGLRSVDTSALELDLGSGLAPPPSGVKLTSSVVGDAEVAVLSLGDLVVDVGLRVVGTRALVVLASGAIELQAVVDVGAHGGEPGPGASAAELGPGKGAPGFSFGTPEGAIAMGGGGAGHGTAGGDSGAGAALSPTLGNVAHGGIAYALALAGGSGGGSGPSFALLGCGQGGAGGGAIQLFARSRISILPAGAIRASGGGGASCAQSAGGGGGSGGFVLLEAPHVAIAGVVAANGGGGANGWGTLASVSGDANGEDGRMDLAPAPGGENPYGGDGGGAGGARDAPPSNGVGGWEAAAGGGAAGRIVVRVTGAANASLDTGTISPAPEVDGSL